MYLLMHKDEAVLKIDNNYNCHILNYDMLPYSLRYCDVNYDDVMHCWTETRTMSIGRTNAKKILSALNIKQNNPYMIAKTLHFASLADCYWLKEDNENITWKDVNFFNNPFKREIINVALFGENQLVLENIPKIYTPEPSTKGMAAKAWVYENDEIWLYKVARKELAASEVLDALDISHVIYEKCTEEEILSYTTLSRIKEIQNNNEAIVKCKCITSENVSMISWEDFCVYCDRHDKNPHEIVKRYFPKEYYEMQIADYVLANDDRHEENWGFLIDNNTGRIIKPYPLMDHDHAFAEGDLYSKTTEFKMTTKQAAIEALQYVQIDFSQTNELLSDSKFINNIEMSSVKNRLNELELSQKTRYTKQSIKSQTALSSYFEDLKTEASINKDNEIIATKDYEQSD